MTTKTQTNDMGRVTRVRRLAQTGQAKRIRLAAGASLQEVATPVGVSPASIYRWEEGKTKPNADRAEAWGEVLEQLERAIGW